MKIGDLILKDPYILAPMAGVTDLPFRILCKRMWGRSFVYGNGQRKSHTLQE